MNKNLTETMGKKAYQKPLTEALSVEAGSILAASEITGTGSDMGWDNGNNAKSMTFDDDEEDY